VSGQLHAPSTLPPGKEPPYPLDRRLIGPQSRSGRHGKVKILAPTGTLCLTLWSPVRSQSLCWLRCPVSCTLLLAINLYRVFVQFDFTSFPVEVRELLVRIQHKFLFSRPLSRMDYASNDAYYTSSRAVCYIVITVVMLVTQLELEKLSWNQPKSPAPGSVVSLLNRVHTIAGNFSIPCKHLCLNWAFPIYFLNQLLYPFLISPRLWFVPPISSSLSSSYCIWRKTQTIGHFIMKFSFVTSSLLSPNFLFSIPFLGTHNLFS
jgi:hypothetical protein